METIRKCEYLSLSEVPRPFVFISSCPKHVGNTRFPLETGLLEFKVNLKWIFLKKRPL